MSYQAFLAPRAPLVLPYFGGTRIDAADRRLRLDIAQTPIAPGWWRFQIDGRWAVPLEPAAPVELGALSALATLRGARSRHPAPARRARGRR